MLTLALTVYEAGLCGCGHPMVLAHDPDNDGWYEAHKPQCQACATQERATAGQGKDPYVPAPGEKVFATFDAAGKQAAAARRTQPPLHQPPAL